jgi:hypothetical protein
VLGGFRDLIGDRAGWVLRLTAKHGSTFLAAVVPNDITHEYDIREGRKVPWWKWLGTDDATDYTLCNGDHPHQYAEEKRHAQATQSVSDPAR